MSGKRLVLVTTSLRYAGAQMQILALARELRVRGWRILLVTMIAPEAFTDELERCGVAWVSLAMKAGVADVRAVFRLRAILKRWRPNVVHAHMVHANLLARVTRLLVRVPRLVCTAHSIDDGGRLRQQAYRFTDRLGDLLTNVSQAGVERFVRVGAVPANKIRYVPNGIDAAGFATPAGAASRLRAALGVADCFVWLAVGRLEGVKDYPTMLRAFALCKQRGFSGQLLIAGTGSSQPHLERLRDTLNLAADVRFLGIRQDVAELMALADAFVLSSTREGLPIVLLEAAASGLPIVATRVGGNREAMVSGQSGLLAPPRDPDTLADCMSDVWRRSAGAREQMGRVGRQHIKSNFDLARIVDTWESIYTGQGCE